MVYMWVYVWAPHAVLMTYMSVSMQMPYSSYYYSFVTYFEIRKHNAFSIVLSKTALAFQCLLWLYTNLKIVLFLSSTNVLKICSQFMSMRSLFMYLCLLFLLSIS